MGKRRRSDLAAEGTQKKDAAQNGRLGQLAWCQAQQYNKHLAVNNDSAASAGSLYEKQKTANGIGLGCVTIWVPQGVSGKRVSRRDGWTPASTSYGLLSRRYCRAARRVRSKRKLIAPHSPEDGTTWKQNLSS